MRYETGQIVEIAADLVLENKLNESKQYDWVDVVGIPSRPDKVENNLYFATYSDGSNGWDNGFDRRVKVKQVQQDQKWGVVVEPGATLNGEHLMVSNLENLTQKLYEELRLKTNPYVIGVTGSVGKTTTVAFLEKILSEANVEVKRFYSKRLTPLGVKCHYLNLIEKETPVVVMEYSAYYADQVGKLAKLLPPNLAFLINIYDTHINPDSFKNKEEVYRSKIMIKKEKTFGLVNERILDELKVERPIGWNCFEIEVPEVNNLWLPPTWRTAEMYSVGKRTAEILGLDHHRFNESFRNFGGAENRIVKTRWRNKELFFHGETSGGARLWSWFETWDKSVPWLFVEQIDFADEDPGGFKNLLEQIMDSDKTVVLDTPENREKLPVKANFVQKSEFVKKLEEARGYLVYHKALASRKTNFEPGSYLEAVWG